MAKRLLDMFVSAVALILLSWLILIVALLVRVNMGSPVLFRQKRPGLNGQPFEMLKFRTMRADTAGGGVASDAQRLTRLGSFLRKTSLDELPELWNILKGDMSLVGPRPLLMQYLDRYSPEQARRHEVRPGLTGWAQVNGRNALSWDEKFALDTWYVDHRSFWLDIRILFLTAWQVVRPKGISAEGQATMPEFMGSPRRHRRFPWAQDRSKGARSLNQGKFVTAANSLEAGAFTAPLEDLSPRPDEAWPFYADDEIEAVTRVLRSGKVNQWTGPDVFAFEAACTERFGGGHGIALTNGSVALELALKALGIGPGDEVIVTPRTFAASAFCVMLVGATPVFADVELDSGNISSRTIAPLINERTRAIIPVHLGGWPCDMPGIMALAAPRGIMVIEDCAQAQGAAIGGRTIGSFGDAAAFSFCQDKIISTAGEGGFLSFRDADAAEWAWSFKDHGKNRAKMKAPTTNPGVFKWVHDQVGTNWRLSGPHAAVGLAQLAKLDAWTETRNRNAEIWTAALDGVRGVNVPRVAATDRHAFYKFYFYLDAPEGEAERLRSRILQQATGEGLRLFSGSCSEVYREEAFASLPASDCPNARRMSGNALMVEVHPTLRPDLLVRRAERLAAIVSEVLGC